MEGGGNAAKASMYCLPVVDLLVRENSLLSCLGVLLVLFEVLLVAQVIARTPRQSCSLKVVEWEERKREKERKVLQGSLYSPQIIT